MEENIKTDISENNKKRTHITVAVPRSYKNIEGVYETDFIRCTLWNAVASSTSEYCHKGDIVGIKGRIQVNSYEDKDGTKKYSQCCLPRQRGSAPGASLPPIAI